MKRKNKIITLIVSLSFCLVALFNIVYFRDNGVGTHETVLEKGNLDYMSMLEEFDEKNLSVVDNNVKLNATQYLDSSFFEEIDNTNIASSGNKGSVSYDINYDGDNNVFILKTTTIDLLGNETITETVGVPFNNEQGELDAAFYDEDGVVFLSQLTEDGIENCGFFSRLRKALKIAAIALAAVAVVAVVVAAVAACPTVAVAVTSIGTKTLVVTGTVGSSALIAGATTVAVAAAVAAGTAWAAAGLAEMVYESYVGTAELTYQRTSYKSLTQTIISALTGIYELTASRVYNIAYVSNGIVNIERSISLTYVEALSVLIAAGFLNGITLPSKMATIALGNFTKGMKDLLSKIKGLNLDSRLIGIYTYEEEDAAKLAYACGGFFNGQFRSENHDVTKGSGHYYHFHDAAHLIHVFYGNPS